MYTVQKNPAALRSQELICRGLCSLMAELPFEEITITRICQEAGVGRKTFYRNYERKEDVLEHVNLHIRPGEMLALVGPSGGGKSTLCQLLPRFYDVTEGAVKVDGLDVRDMKLENLRDMIGFVPQKAVLFSGSIRDNLKWRKNDATDEELLEAVKIAQATDVIEQKGGLDGKIEAEGRNLSGGQRQRLTIARALVGNPKILILDEATSALDTESEYQVQQALERLRKGRTTFAIAHRLSTLRNADRLVVIDGHSIAEVGTHDELMEKKGIYYKLWTLQNEQLHKVMEGR